MGRNKLAWFNGIFILSFGSGFWNKMKGATIFIPGLLLIGRKIPLKSAYIVDQSNRFSLSIFNWKKLWNSKLHNRHKLLIWRIISDILPKAKLNQLFQIHDLNCFLCNANVENLNHLFVNCPFTQQLWFISNWNYNINVFSDTSFKDWLCYNNMFYSQVTRDEFIVFTAVLLDSIWLNRNKIAHGSPGFSVQDLLIKITKSEKDHWSSILKAKTCARSSPNQIWSPPPTGRYKIDTDTAFIDGNAFSSSIVRNNKGSIIMASTNKHF